MPALLTSWEAACELAWAVSNTARGEAPDQGLDEWTCASTPGVLRFLHHDGRGEADGAVFVVHAPEERRDRFATALGLAPWPARLLMLDD